MRTRLCLAFLAIPITTPAISGEYAQTPPPVRGRWIIEDSAYTAADIHANRIVLFDEYATSDVCNFSKVRVYYTGLFRTGRKVYSFDCGALPVTRVLEINRALGIDLRQQGTKWNIRLALEDPELPFMGTIVSIESFAGEEFAYNLSAYKK